MEIAAGHSFDTSLPAELLRDAPREVELTGKGRAVIGLAIALASAALVATVWLSAAASRDARRWQSWKAEAVTTSASITALYKRGSGDDTSYYANYSYRVDGREYSGRVNMRGGAWRRLRTGQPIDVRYRRSEPGTSWVPGHEPKGVPAVAPILVGTSMLLPVPFLAYAVRRQRRLLEEGRGARARVTECKRIRSENGTRYVVRYEFETLAGARRTGRYDARRQPPAVGDELTVVYHPDEEAWNAKYPLCLVRVRQ